MRQFNWATFLQRHRIEYAAGGYNEIVINCPMCRDDPSCHMAISLSGKGWHCWRAQSHRGKDPTRLVAALLRISLTAAKQITGSATTPTTSDSSLHGLISLMMDKPEEVVESGALQFPPDIKPLLYSRATEPFFSYLLRRGYSFPIAERLTERFSLRYALTGAFAYRLVVPIFNAAGELVSWTGRAIAPDQATRYKTLSTKTDSPKALAPSSDCLLQEHVLGRGGETLVVCEGPFDAMRVSMSGFTGTCLFTKLISDAQVAKLTHLALRFERRCLLLDNDAKMSSLMVIERLRGAGFQNIHLPLQYDDPGDTPMSVLKDLFTMSNRGLGNASKRSMQNKAS